jgi:hypothetical protein
MRIFVASLAVCFFLSASGVEAGWFHRNKTKKRCLPKPIDWPTIRPKADDTHKAGKRTGRHPNDCHPY